MKNLKGLKNSSFALILCITLAGCWGKKDKAQEITKDLNEKAEDEVKTNAETASTNMSNSESMEVADSGNRAQGTAPDAEKTKENLEGGPVNVAAYNTAETMNSGNLAVENFGSGRNVADNTSRFSTASRYTRGGGMNWQQNDDNLF